MNQVLSQSEVDALLAAVSDGDVASSDAPKAEAQSSASKVEDRKIVSYDLTSQDRIIRGRLPQLEVIYEKFMRAFRVSLS
jgi:flagellar motor switch protein FliM